jgi:hypothetical protein
VDDTIFGDEDFRAQRAPPRRMIRVRDVMRELRRRSATSRAKNEATLANALENSLPAFWDFRTGDVVVHGHQIQDDDAVKSNTQLQAHEFTVVGGRRHRCPRNSGRRSCPQLDNYSPNDTNNSGDDVLCKHRDFHASRTQRHRRQIRIPIIMRTFRRMPAESRTAHQFRSRRPHRK